MAYDIGPRIGIDGEAEFRKQIRSINGEMASLRFELDKSSASFKGQEKSQLALTEKSKILTKEVENQRKKVGECNDMLAKSTLKYGEADEKTIKWKATTEKARAELVKMENALSDTNKQLDFVTSGFGQFQLSMDSASGKFTKIGDVAQGVGKTLTTHLSLPIVAAGTAAVKAAIDYEDAFAGVRKTVDGTEEQLAKLSDGILALSERMPESATQIAGVAEAAGQLGIKTESILSFTETMVMLGDATNLTSEEAATALARFANVTQMSQDEFSNLGSSIVALGNNFATTESEITNMGQNLAAAGYQVGMSEADIMALATAMSSVGIEAEAGGSAMSKLMIEIQLATEQGGDSLNQFAAVAGMSADEFTQAFKTNAGGAIKAFVTGLNDTDRTGQSAIATLDDMGISEVRMRNAILSLSSSGDLLNNTMSVSEEAFASNTALQKEAAARYETTASKLKILWNQAVKVAIEFGGEMLPVLEDVMDSVSGVVKWFGSLTDEQKKAVVQIGAVVAATGPLISGVGKVSTGLGAITKQLGSDDLIAKLGGFATKTTTAGTASAAAGTSTAGFGASLASIAPVAGPVAIGIGAVAIAFLAHKENAARAAGALKDVQEKTDTVKASNTTVLQSIEDARASFEKESAAIEVSAVQATGLANSLINVVEQEGNTAAGKEKIAAMVETLNGLVPGLNLAYDETRNVLSKTNDELLNSITNMQEQARTAANQEMLVQTYKDQAAVIQNLASTRQQASDIQNELNAKESEYNELAGQQSSLVDMIDPKYVKLGDEIANLKTQKGDLSAQTQDLQQKWLDSQTAIQEYSTSVNGISDTYTFVADTSILSKDQVEVYNQALQDGKSGPEAYQEAINSIKTSMEDVSKNAKTEGENANAGYREGFNSVEPLHEFGKSAIGQFIKGIRNALDSNSPSRVMDGIGVDAFKGFFNGVINQDWIGTGLAAISNFLAGVNSQKQNANAMGQDVSTSANTGLSSLWPIFNQTGSSLGGFFNAGLFNQAPNAETTGYSVASQGDVGLTSWISAYGLTGTRGGVSFANALGNEGINANAQGMSAAAQGGSGFNSGVDAWTTVAKIKEAATAIWNGFCEVLGINSPAESFKWAAQMCLDGFKEKFTPDNWMSLAKQGARSIYDAFSNSNLSVKGLFEALGSNMSGIGAFGDFLRDKLGLDASGLMGTLNQILFPSGGSSGSGTYIGSGGLQWPSDTTAITDYFGNRESPGGIGSTYHEGVDIGAPYGSPVYAAGSGSASIAGWYGGYGNAVKLDHGNGLSTLYGHMSEVLTSVGANVRTGETIGLVGSTGNSTGPHIHFSVLVNGEQVDPMNYFGFSVGTRYLPQDMVIQAHAGEMIIPKSENPYANSGGSITGGLFGGSGLADEIGRAVAAALLSSKGIGNSVKIETNNYTPNPSPSETERATLRALRKAGLADA
ncbi:MAG: phage tail tape measure protein [Christensenella sp.]|uniref:phage tail tape measure protein n=1 Tax=Christensenella sp. TaxID=1935934 RepID=UPI002B2070E1|nr:phage tail tape measure protein [Christensenella sp.]MEA5004726.1 phage tail tape measure protein [Christensenella sp.]